MLSLLKAVGLVKNVESYILARGVSSVSLSSIGIIFMLSGRENPEYALASFDDMTPHLWSLVKAKNDYPDLIAICIRPEKL